MFAKKALVNFMEHGVCVDEQKKRVKCNYCGKVVSGFYRLKYHLGGIKGDVTPCESVPESVKEPIRNLLLEKRKQCLSKVVGKVDHPNRPSKRTSCHQMNNGKPSNTSTIEGGSIKHVKIGPVPQKSGVESVSFPNRTNFDEAVVRSEDSPSCQTKMSIGRFFLEAGIEFDAAMIPGLQRMINSILVPGETRHMIPTCQEFKGWILQSELKETQNYVQEIRSSWKEAGCSILLDGWTDAIGRNLVNILVDCPKGTIYLHSFDISAIVEDVHAMNTFLEKVLNEVGVDNVVQIISYSSSTFMQTLGRQFMDKHRTIFWTVCASHCIEMMLKEMGMMNHIHDTLQKAMTITRFVYNHDFILKLWKTYNDERDLVKPYKIRYAKPFVTLENLMSEQDNLRKMFTLSECYTSICAFNAEAKKVSDIVTDCSFWDEVGDVLNATIPLVSVLDLLNKGDKQQLGLIYETIDQAKETIKGELNDEESQYMPFWEVIDNIWNNWLHSPLHSAGYFLNPSLFYSSDFLADPEVVNGLLCCIVRMAEGSQRQDLITSQLDEYRDARDDFRHASDMSSSSGASPATWWATYGVKCPDLKKFAIRILSQTCVGGSRFALKRDLAEKLLIKGRNPLEHVRLCNFVYLHYNMQLRNLKSSAAKNISADEVDPMDDWIVYSAKEVPCVMPTNLDGGDTINSVNNSSGLNGNAPSSSFPKVEAV